jgi:hypothetical protein
VGGPKEPKHDKRAEGNGQQVVADKDLGGWRGGGGGGHIVVQRGGLVLKSPHCIAQNPTTNWPEKVQLKAETPCVSGAP